MARITAGIATSHIPAVGAALDNGFAIERFAEQVAGLPVPVGDRGEQARRGHAEGHRAVEQPLQLLRGDPPAAHAERGEHLVELQWQLIRAVRVHVDVGIHTGRMTFDQAVAWFRSAIERAEAKGEVPIGAGASALGGQRERGA